jgi:thioesterase domain-containing protein
VPQEEEDDPTSPAPFLSEEERKAIPHISRLLHLTEELEVIQSSPRHQPPATPLFLIHDGSGICTHYRRLRPLNRPVFALHDPRFLLPLETNSSNSHWPDLPTMATHYADLISSSSSQGQLQQPLILGGWSFGGVVAFEAARTLLARGDRPVAGVVLIDAPPPLRHVPLSDGIIRAVTTSTESSSSSSTNATATAMRKLIHRSFSRCASLLGAFSAALSGTTTPKDSRPIPRVILLRAKEGWVSPPGYPSSTGEYENAWLQDRGDPGLATRGWDEVTGQAAGTVRYIDIPGDHFTVFDKANVGEVSAVMGRACRELLELEVEV